MGCGRDVESVVMVDVAVREETYLVRKLKRPERLIRLVRNQLVVYTPTFLDRAPEHCFPPFLLLLPPSSAASTSPPRLAARLVVSIRLIPIVT